MVGNGRRDAWWATPKRCSDMGPSVRVNTRTPKIDAPRIQRTGVSRGGQHPRKKLLQRADLVRDARQIAGCPRTIELSRHCECNRDISPIDSYRLILGVVNATSTRHFPLASP